MKLERFQPPVAEKRKNKNQQATSQTRASGETGLFCSVSEFMTMQISCRFQANEETILQENTFPGW